MFYKRLCTKLLPASAFNANLFLRRGAAVKSVKSRPIDLIPTAIESVEIHSVNDWLHVRQAILDHEFNKGQYTRENIDAMIIGYCANARRYDLGTSYLSFLNQENLKPNLATLGKYLKLLYVKNWDACLESGSTCTRTEEDQILLLYKNVRKEYPILDSYTLENAVLALSITTEWKQCLELLQEIRVSSAPSTMAYSAVISAAFLNNEEGIAWLLLQDLLEYDKEPRSTTFLSYLNTVWKIEDKEIALAKLEKLFMFFHNSGLKCTQDLAVRIGELAEKLGFHQSLAKVSYTGICKSCCEKLDHFDLTDEEFESLKEKIFEKVLIGRDVFLKTHPDELERFENFVKCMGKFDVVLDGLNVAYSAGTKQSPHVYSALVSSVVSYFVTQRRKILLLGRVHMARWPQKNWGYITNHATVFLTQNISQDDPYLLYCALHSGKDTIIVTRDLMRGHKFLLREPKDKMLFKLWLSQRQYQLLRVDERKGPLFKIPPQFSILAQEKNGQWHIPYDMEFSQDKSDFHQTWLCLNH